MNIMVERALHMMEMWADDAAHGYDQQFRWGERGDYDCSSAVISAYETAGIPVKSKGKATYTGNMYPAFIICGFEDVTASVDLVHGSGLQRGDVLLNHKNHTAMYAGGGKTVEASINELGTTTGGQPGDQTGREFFYRVYRNYPWDVVLRYTGAENTVIEKPAVNPVKLVSAKLPQLKNGDIGPAVSMLQAALKYHGYDPQWIDGEFGTRTNNMLMAFQAEHGLETDGICGPDTWSALGEV